MSSKKSKRIWILFSLIVSYLWWDSSYNIIANSFSHPMINLAILALGVILFSIAYSLLPWIFRPFYHISFRSGELRVRINNVKKIYLLKQGSSAFLFLGHLHVELINGRKMHFPIFNKKRTNDRLEKAGLLIKRPSSNQQNFVYFAFGFFIYFLMFKESSIGDEYFGALILTAVVYSLRNKLSDHPDQIINLSKNIHALKKKQMRDRTVKLFGTLLIASIVLGFISDLPLSRDDRSFYVQSKIFEKHPDAEGLEAMVSLASAGFSSTQLNQVAWFYTVVPNMELRDPKKAVELSNLSLKIHSTREGSDTYVCALMADHQNEKAIKLAQKINLRERVKQFQDGNLCEDAELFSGTRNVASSI